MSAAELVAGLLFGACQEYLGGPDVRALFPMRRAIAVAAQDSGRESAPGVLNWGDMVDGEHDLWMLNMGASWS